MTEIDPSPTIEFIGLRHFGRASMALSVNIELNEVDRRIWREELDDFVPRRVFDVHTHIYRWENNTDPKKEGDPLYPMAGRQFPLADWVALDACDQLLMPGREVHRLSFPFPFARSCDYQASNRFVAQEVAHDPQSDALMLVHPSMHAEYLEQQIREHGFLGLKPYRFYATTGDPVECGITDFLPEHQIEVANRHGLLTMMHLAKHDGIADRQNIADLQRFADRYPRVRWILAHCARSYSPWPIEQAARHIRDLTNLWYDTSSVCDSDTIDALLSNVGPERVMYGSDDLPVGASRGKYIAYGYAWAYLSESNHHLDLSHCNPQMSFVRYEQLRAMRRASKRLGLSEQQIDDLFCNTASRLIQSVRDNVERGGV